MATLFTTIHRIWGRLRGATTDRDAPEVLVALFGNDTDPQALRLAAFLASEGRVEALRLLEVARDRPLPTAEESRRLLESERKRLGRLAGAIRVEPARQPGTCLLERAARIGPALLVLSSSHPADDSTKMLLERVFQDSLCDVLLAHLPAGADPLAASVIIVPLTLEAPLAAGAEHWLARLARPSGIAVRLQGVLEVPRSLPTDTPLLQEEQELSTRLAESAQRLQAMGVKTSQCLKRTRQFSDELARTALEPHALLFLDASLPSRPEDLWERATCPTLLCRTSDSAKK